MLTSLIRRKPKASPLDRAFVPEGTRLYVIGDVHGRLDLLNELLVRIDEDDATRPNAEIHLIFLGDLVDRGMESRGVVERAMQLAEVGGGRVRFLMGNHEEVMLGAATGDEKHVKFFCRIGGKETLFSYGLSPEDYQRLQIEELSERVATLFPRAHLDFVSRFESRIVFGDYAFVHAGIRPGVPLDEQRIKDLRWIREEFILDDEPHDKVIVHGHTISENVEECHNRIGIDTGAYMSGRLTALCLEENRRWYLQTGAEAKAA
ncbi:MAG: metallophosphoesterase family protein [Blastomonas sp.]